MYETKKVVKVITCNTSTGILVDRYLTIKMPSIERYNKAEKTILECIATCRAKKEWRTTSSHLGIVCNVEVIDNVRYMRRIKL